MVHGLVWNGSGGVWWGDAAQQEKQRSQQTVSRRSVKREGFQFEVMAAVSMNMELRRGDLGLAERREGHWRVVAGCGGVWWAAPENSPHVDFVGWGGSREVRIIMGVEVKSR